MIATVNDMNDCNAPVSRLTSLGDFSAGRSTWNDDSLSSGKFPAGVVHFDDGLFTLQGKRAFSVNSPDCQAALRAGGGANPERLNFRRQPA